MTPTQTTFLDMLSKLAASTATLNKTAGSENLMALVISNFTPSRDLVIGDLTLATFTGSDPLEVTAGAQQVGFDPVRGQWFIELIPPVGGWYWECSAAPADPERVYGLALTDNPGTGLLGSWLLPDSVLIQSVADSVGTGPIRFYESDLA